MLRPSPGIRGATTALGFAPALVFLTVAGFLHAFLAVGEILMLRLGEPLVVANVIANAWLLGGLAAVYGVWVLALARRWLTAATGGGFAVAGAGLILRIVVEMPQVLAQTPLAECLPPEPYATALVLGRGLGLVAYAFGLACVVAASLSERRLRAGGPAWTLPR